MSRVLEAMNALRWRSHIAGERTSILALHACAIALCALGCTRITDDSCSMDADCDRGKICREAICRKPCLSSHWVGEHVEITSGRLIKQGEISACEQRRTWVRYESGVEEQIDDLRFVKRARK